MSAESKTAARDPGRAALRRRDFLLLSASGALLGCAESGPRRPAQRSTEFEPMWASVADLRGGLASGQLTARSICEALLDRIETVDAAGPSLNSVIEVNPAALSEADRLDSERRAGELRGPLHGIPVMLKDNIDTADDMQTTAGSLALVDSGVPRDSAVAAKLRSAGALLIAKTNLSEWANFRSRDSTSGWSARGGLTRNPYFLDRNACGSSSGSGVAVSAGLTPLAIGTETNGSIVCPSSVNGIVGIKPTVGLVGRSGIVPISHTQDTAGPMARTVADAAELLGALAGADPLDTATHSGGAGAPGSYTEFLDDGALRGSRIGLLREYWGRHPGIDRMLDDAVAAMRSGGAELIDIAELPRIRESNGPGFELMLYEFKAGLNTYLSGLSATAKVRTLADVIRFNETNRAAEMPYFGQDILESAEEKGPLTDQAYLDAVTASRDRCRAAIDTTMSELELDALFAPTTGPAWVTDLVHGDRSSFPSCSSAAARAGYPHVTVPGGFVLGLPVGVSFFGPAWSEPRLIGLAHSFEQSTRHRDVPRMQPGTGPA
ncbi:MAG: amidase [Bryobacterales bacterium]|nr:amidase [Bryobacterales bacterium]